MKKSYYELEIEVSSFKDEISNFLMERVFNGIEERGNTLILRSEESLNDLKKELKSYIKNLEELFNARIDYQTKIEEKSNEDWVKKYQNTIKPVEIDNFYIHPSWYKPQKNKINILIDPALAFGSGHHESTRNCIKAIKKCIKDGDTLLDLGCGSGILGIVGAKLGGKVSLCDTDSIAIKSTKENFKLNNVTYNEIWIGSANNTNKRYDIVIANIIADVLIFMADDLKKRTSNILILSGILDKYKNRVLEKYKNFRLLEEIKENEWITLVLKRK